MSCLSRPISIPEGLDSLEEKLFVSLKSRGELVSEDDHNIVKTIITFDKYKWSLDTIGNCDLADLIALITRRAEHLASGCGNTAKTLYKVLIAHGIVYGIKPHNMEGLFKVIHDFGYGLSRSGLLANLMQLIRAGLVYKLPHQPGNADRWAIDYVKFAEETKIELLAY